MNEIDLLKKLIEKKGIEHDLQLRTKIWSNKSNEAEKIRCVQELQNVSAEIENLENQLTEIEDKTYSREAKECMIDQLDRYITEINKVNPSLNLSRNQNLLTNNELFTGIVRDINYLITDRASAIHIPANLKYTNNSVNSIKIADLTDFLRNEINILRNIQSPNYLILWQYKDELIDRINVKFIE